MNKELQKQIRNLIGESFTTNSNRRLLDEITNELMKQVYIYKGRADYRSKYIDMCYRDIARIDGINIDDYS